MPKQLGTILAALADKAKIKKDHPGLIELMSINAQVSDEIATGLENLLSLMDVDAAKNNAELKKYFHSQVYNAFDAITNTLTDELGLDDAIKAELKGIDKTTERIPALVKKVKELEAKKAGANKGDKDAYTKQIDELNGQVLALKKSAEDQVSALKAKHDSDLLNYALKTHLSGYEYANDQLPKNVNVLTAQQLLQHELATKKVKLIRDENDNISLKQSENPEMDYHENNVKVSFTDFTNGVLANNKLLKVYDPAKPGNDPTPPVPGAPVPDPQIESFYKNQMDRAAAAQ